MTTTTEPIVVTGANGLVGAHVCAALSERGAQVRAVVRRAGTAPELPGVEEFVGVFHEQPFASEVCAGARAVVNTVHPMRDAELEEASVGWAETLAKAASATGTELFIQVSTTSVYKRTEDTGDVDEDSELVDDDDRPYAVTKRDTDRAVMAVESMTRVLVRPTAILGAGESSIWNTVRPRAIKDDEDARRDDPDRTFGWVHVTDLAALIADLTTGAIAPAATPAEGPVRGEATAVNAVSGTVPLREYMGPVCEAVGVEPLWEERPAFGAELRADRARAWGWRPAVGFDQAMREVVEGLG